MSKILAFAGSLSKHSINHQLVSFTSTLLRDSDVEVIRLTDYDAPIYRSELEKESGIPEAIARLRKKFDDSDGFILSTPEYNSSIPAGLKNTLDWISRMEGSIFQDKPVLLMATSPGGRGGQSVLNHLFGIMPFWGAQLVGTFSLPKFGENFMDDKIISTEHSTRLEKLVNDLEARLEQA